MMHEHDHAPDSIRRRLDEGPATSYLRDWIYGGIDGAVTTFAVVSGVVGANLSPGIILILGGANLLADGFSMAASNFAGTRAEHDEFEMIRQMEYEHVKSNPEGEIEEVRQIFERKGFTGSDLEGAVRVVTSDPDLWVTTMLAEEFGLARELRSPILAAVSTMSAFLVCGAIPLLPYVFRSENAFTFSLVSTGIAFFAIGSLKSRWSVLAWWRSGLETFVIGSIAAALAFYVGKGLAMLGAG